MTKRRSTTPQQTIYRPHDDGRCMGDGRNRFCSNNAIFIEIHSTLYNEYTSALCAEF